MIVWNSWIRFIYWCKLDVAWYCIRDQAGYAMLGIALLLCISTGCSNTNDEVKAAVTSYSRAVLAGDSGTAWEYLSLRCKNELPRKVYAPIVSVIASTFKQGAPKFIKLDQREGTASIVWVTYEFEGQPELTQHNEPWVNEQGWKNDEC